MEYPEGYSTAMRCVARKVAAVEGGLVWFGSGFTAGMLFSRQMDLYVTLSLSIIYNRVLFNF